MTNEQPQVHRALATAGVAVLTLSRVTALAGGEATVANLFTGAERRLPCRSLVIVGVRRATDSLYQALCARNEDFAAAGIISVDRIGDALAPGALVHAIYSGHRFARELDADPAVREVFLGTEVTAALAGGTMDARPAPGEDGERSEP